jgi:hypothetical protein
VDVRPLLHDGALRLEADPRHLGALARWLPLLPREGPVARESAVLRVLSATASPAPPPAGHRTLALGRVRAWVEGERALLAGDAALRGTVALDAGDAELRAPLPRGEAAADEAVAWELYSACTLASALLLGRLGRALAHAAAVADREGRGWLLVGDSRAGKTTTCANLLSAGWEYLSDDHVVLRRTEDGEIAVEGWPRPFHLDPGWERGERTGTRHAADPRERWPGRWRRTAPLAGLLFPRVEAELPTALEELPAGAALAALLRQSPWLLADRGAAPGVLSLLRDAALLPARALRLGRDSYAAPPVLAAALRPLSALPIRC